MCSSSFFLVVLYSFSFPYFSSLTEYILFSRTFLLKLVFSTRMKFSGGMISKTVGQNSSLTMNHYCFLTYRKKSSAINLKGKLKCASLNVKNQHFSRPLFISREDFCLLWLNVAVEFSLKN